MNINIVMPNFNGEKYLHDSIDAFLAQDVINKKLFVVDGKSTDGSHSILESYSRNSNIFWIRTTDTGLSNAINMGINAIDYDSYFMFCGTDDILLPGSLRKISESASPLQNADAFYFNSYSKSANGNYSYHSAPSTINRKTLKKSGTSVGFQNIAIKASIAKDLLVDEALKYAMDLEFYLRMMRFGHSNIVYIPIESTINISDQNISSKYRYESELESIRIRLKYCGYSAALLTRMAYVRSKIWLKSK